MNSNYRTLIPDIKRQYRIRYNEDITDDELITVALTFLSSELKMYNKDKNTQRLSKIKRKV